MLMATSLPDLARGHTDQEAAMHMWSTLGYHDDGTSSDLSLVLQVSLLLKQERSAFSIG